ALKLEVSIRMATQVQSRLKRMVYFLEGLAPRTIALQVNLILRDSLLSYYARTSFRHIKYPVLEEMVLDFRTHWLNRSGPHWNVCSFTLPEDAPNLRSISMIDLVPDLESTTLSGLTRLVLDAPAFDSVTWPPECFWEVLENATALKYLELQSWTAFEQGDTQSFPSLQYPRTIVPNLLQLVLRGFDPSDLIYILSTMDAPELNHVVLELSGFSKQFNPGWDAVKTNHPFPSVSSLDLRLPFRNTPTSHEQFPAFLTRLFPNVKELSIPLEGSLSVLRR
ncbi:hypothetical protein FRC01_013324, partial [Tulasnella sp. 417]